MFVNADTFYEDKAGNLFTEEYLKQRKQFTIETKYLHRIPDEEKFKIKGYIHCNYDQLFHQGDALILCNNIMHYYENLELLNGDDSIDEVFQFYIIPDYVATHLIAHTNEIIYYYENLDIYILGVTHCGTSWDYVGAEYKL